MSRYIFGAGIAFTAMAVSESINSYYGYTPSLINAGVFGVIAFVCFVVDIVREARTP